MASFFAMIGSEIFVARRAPVEGAAGPKSKAFVEIRERGMELLASDKAKSSKPISLGPLPDETADPLQMFCWSADGSVIARATRKSPESTTFSVAYDFDKHELVGSISPHLAEGTSDRITSLLAERGGQAPFMAEIGPRIEKVFLVWAWLPSALILFLGGLISWRLIRKKAFLPCSHQRRMPSHLRG
ncbi:hypothetical protein [Luteolibacter luteus]|uniref:Uncharacterized protein n=1 Tax=Luteolibacter luteus TaxID=2728835 RepID=A0A858RIT9_9BACT|nr:hypothetical protein [Luteolibacter luteus]QJE96408.1 hypothetical protein HHL09_11650 [Luteolibacter luteus]